MKNYVAGIRMGTAVTRGILDSLGSPDEKLKIIHIAGTNGKGSTAEYLTQILMAAGKRTGTFTSPAVFSYAEQFRVDGAALNESKIEKYLEAARKAASGLNATQFEVETAGALYAFYREGCEYAVVECGMGGRDDATNAINKKEVAVITSIGLEHTAYLGNTLRAISENKAGIIKNCPVVVSALQPAEVTEFFKEKGAIFADKPITEVSPCGNGGQAFNYGGCGFCVRMAGEAQPYNAAAAIEAARLLKIDEGAIYAGVKAAKLGGRAEILQANGATYILDGAHNPAAFKPLASLLSSEQFCNKQKVIIFGCLSDKDMQGNLKRLSGLAREIIAVKCPSPRAADLGETERACRKYFKEVKTAGSVAEAMAETTAEIVVVCVSFTLLKEAKNWIEKEL